MVFRAPPTTPYPLSFTTSCFHEFGRPNPGLSQIQDVSRESRRMSREKKRRLWEGDLKEVFKASAENISRNFTETTSHYPVPIVFQQGGDEEEQNWEKSKKKRRAEIFALWKEKIPQVFQKRSRSCDLAARLAAPQSFIDKETRTTFSSSSWICNEKKEKSKQIKPTKTTDFHWKEAKKENFQKQKIYQT